MWNMKCVVRPVISGATGTVTEGLKKSLVAVPVKHSVDSIRTAAVLGMSHAVRNVCSLKLEA